MHRTDRPVQRMQVMQRISSVSMGCFRGMAFTGQTAGAFAASGTLLSRVRMDEQTAEGTQKRLFRNGNRRKLTLCEPVPNHRAELRQPSRILVIRSSGGNLGDDAVLSDSADSRNGEISRFARRIPQFGKRILIRPIAVCAQQNGARTAAARLRQAGQRNLRNAPPKQGTAIRQTSSSENLALFCPFSVSERSMVSNRSEIAADNSPAALRTPPVGLKTS